MLQLTPCLRVYSLWRGQSQWEGHPVRCFRCRELARILIELPRWCIRQPHVLMQAMQCLLENTPTNLKNVGETVLGLGFAVVQARNFEREPPDSLHAAWATMPATACWLIHQLTGIPFTMGAHAYDMYADGGDCLLVDKLKKAALIHTSSHAARQHLLRLHPAARDKLVTIHRGLDTLPTFAPRAIDPTRPLRLLSIGRLVEKKGWNEQLDLLAAVKQRGIVFKARIVGHGPLHAQLLRKRQHLHLDQAVEFTGAIDHPNLAQHYHWADAFLFTGKIARNGDRDGLPNVIAEAMAYGVPVLTTAVAGTTEAIHHNTTGWILPLYDPQAWIDTLLQLNHRETTLAVQKNARQWVAQHFIAAHNTRQWFDCMRQAVADSTEALQPRKNDCSLSSASTSPGLSQ